MFFWRKKTDINKIKLERIIFHKISKMDYDYYSFKKNRKKYSIINSVVKNVPVLVNEDKIIARVRCNEIPDAVVHFILNINNIQKEYISSSNTINIFINAKVDIENERYKCCRFELLPAYERRVLACTTY